MGENDSAMEYDENLIFTHLYAFLPLLSVSSHNLLGASIWILPTMLARMT